MRYAKSESTYILGTFNTGDTVTIDVYRLSDNVKVVDGVSCSEVAGTGIFKYLFSQTISQKEEYLWIMSNGEYSKCGKIVLGGWMDGVTNEVQNHRNVVEPKIDTKISSRASQTSVDAIPTNPLLDNDLRLDNLDASISSRLASDDNRLDNLDAPISSRSSHSPTDVWSYPTRELSNPDNYKADISALALEATVQAIKSKTDNLPDNPASSTDINNAKADIILKIETNRDLIEELLDIEEGNWEIKDNQMIFYKRDGSELMRFNLFDKSGHPAEVNVFKRERI